jgi:Phage integrase family
MALISRCVTHSGTVWGSSISEKVVWWVVRQCAKKAAIDRVAPHELRRTCARLCHSAGGELEQIQFLLGHRSVETTKRYPGSRRSIAHAVNDRLGIEPDSGAGYLFLALRPAPGPHRPRRRTARVCSQSRSVGAATRTPPEESRRRNRGTSLASLELR